MDPNTHPNMHESRAFQIRPVDETDRSWVLQMLLRQGGDFVISRGRTLLPADLPGFVAEASDGERLGLATYEITGLDCELVTLDAARRGIGVGTALLAAVRDAAIATGCRRLWLITTNDNLDALRFYQRRGMQLVGVHRRAVETSRRSKPQIPLVGDYGIPIRDELELEVDLPPGG